MIHVITNMNIFVLSNFHIFFPIFFLIFFQNFSYKTINTETKYPKMNYALILFYRLRRRFRQVYRDKLAILLIPLILLIFFAYVLPISIVLSKYLLIIGKYVLYNLRNFSIAYMILSYLVICIDDGLFFLEI